jgi:ArsR family transcriptional regulator, arsenate/arsenite/antimonite-responsive transcriptional repressor
LTPPAVGITLMFINSMIVDESTPVVVCCRPLAEAELSGAEAEAAADLFKALADPARVKLVNLLATSDEPVCVCHLIEPLGLTQPTVSHHLKKLTRAGLLDREQRGVWAYYSINREAMARLASLVELNGGT